MKNLLTVLMLLPMISFGQVQLKDCDSPFYREDQIYFGTSFTLLQQSRKF